MLPPTPVLHSVGRGAAADPDQGTLRLLPPPRLAPLQPLSFASLFLQAYYSRDFTAEERQRGLHHSVLRFVSCLAARGEGAGGGRP